MNDISGFIAKTSVYHLHKNMAEHNISMIYMGDFNQDITKSVLSMTEKKFENEGLESGLRKKVFNVMVESLQNICKHQNAVQTDGANSPMFMVGNDGEDYLVISGNAIANDKIDLVKNKVDHINTLDKEGLKALYKEARLGSSISNVGGAGLGFIDMARKSGKPLEYVFTEIDEKISYFTLCVIVSKNEVE